MPDLAAMLPLLDTLSKGVLTALVLAAAAWFLVALDNRHRMNGIAQEAAQLENDAKRLELDERRRSHASGQGV